MLQSEATAASHARELTKTHEAALLSMGERLDHEQDTNQQLSLQLEDVNARLERTTTQATSSEQVATQLQSDLQVTPLSLPRMYQPY